MVAHLFDERDGAVEKMIAMAIAAAHRAERKSAAAVKRLLTIRSPRFLVEKAITSMSVKPGW